MNTKDRNTIIWVAITILFILILKTNQWSRERQTASDSRRAIESFNQWNEERQRR